MERSNRFAGRWIVGLFVGLAGASLASGSSVGAAEIDFAHDIGPILLKHCGKCHAGDKQQGGLSLNTREGLLAGGESGRAVTPGKSGSSALIERLVTDDAATRMPPEGARVPAADVAKLRRWIDAGLPWDDGLTLLKTAYEPPLRPRRPALPPGDGHPIDRLVRAYSDARKLPPSPPADDATLLRRASLDLVGLLPESNDLQSFLNDPSPDKRAATIRRLLDDDVAYAEHWLSFWNDLLRNDYSGTGFITGGRKQITGWLYRSLVENKPYDRMVRELIDATPESEGFIQGIRWRGDVSAGQTTEIQFSQSVSQSLLGINMKCASCHDSFVDGWKLNDAYGLAAIFSQRPLAIHRCDKPTGATAAPRWLFPELGDIDPQAAQPARMKRLAELMTHPENGRLSRTIVNRLWQRMTGRGIVHPVDAMDTAPWSADLLDYLAADLQDHGYDLKRTLTLIATSQTYQARTPPLDEQSTVRPGEFRGPLARRLTAEQFVDVVWQLTGAAPQKPDAQVYRGRPASGPTASTPAAAPLTARWIWSRADASASAPAGETIAVRRRFDLPAAPRSAVGAITCDNEYRLYVNGQPVQNDDNWETVEPLQLENRLKAGSNELLIVATNGGAGGNPAGLFFELRIETTEGAKPLVVGSDESWQWTSTRPDARGRFKSEPTDWKPAAPVANPDVWHGRTGGDLAAVFSNPPQRRMVRASLMKNDFLMRALGRPHREQIVTVRPSELTTLEAIDLANSEILAGYLTQGGRRWAAEFAGRPDELAVEIYRRALCRPPSADEAAVAREMLGAAPTPEQTADLLWCVLMLPEFQFVR